MAGHPRCYWQNTIWLINWKLFQTITDTHTHARTYECTQVHTRTHTHTHTHAHTHTRAHTQSQSGHAVYPLFLHAYRVGIAQCRSRRLFIWRISVDQPHHAAPRVAYACSTQWPATLKRNTTSKRRHLPDVSPPYKKVVLLFSLLVNLNAWMPLQGRPLREDKARSCALCASLSDRLWWECNPLQPL